MIPAALQEHQLLVVLPLWHKHVLGPAHLAGLYHFVLTLKGCAKVLELVLDVFHWKETQKSKKKNVFLLLAWENEWL